MEIPEIIELAQSATHSNFIGKFSRAIQGLADYVQRNQSAVDLDNYTSPPPIKSYEVGTPRTNETTEESPAAKYISVVDLEFGGPHIVFDSGKHRIAVMKAAIPDHPDNTKSVAFFRQVLNEIIATERAAEREECAKICEELAATHAKNPYHEMAQSCASYIRGK